MKTSIKLMFFFLSLTMIMSGCKKEEDGDLPSVITKDAVQISAQSAVCNAEVTDEGGTPLKAKGVCWSNNNNPSIEGNHTDNGTTTGAFASSITSLSPNTTYYYKAYATNNAGTAYGETKSFTTTL